MTQAPADNQTPESELSDSSVVRVRQVNDTDWQTLYDLTVVSGGTTFTVKSPQDTDFASVPRVFVWLLPRYGRYTKAAILHDHLCRVPDDPRPRSEADRIFREAMRELEVAFLRRWIMWAAVRLGALTTSHGRNGWLKDCWQVFPIALVALPIVGPPAVVIVAALLVFYLVERVVQGILAGVNLVRRIGRKDPIPVNKPSLLLKL